MKNIVEFILEKNTNKYYPGMWAYYPETKELSGDMGYEFNDTGDLIDTDKNKIIEGIKDFLSNDYIDQKEEIFDDCVVVCFVDLYKSSKEIVPEILYISEIDKKYSNDIVNAFNKKYNVEIPIKIINKD